MPEYEFTILLENTSPTRGDKNDAKRGVVSGPTEMASMEPTSSSGSATEAPGAESTGSLSDDEILRGIRFVETSAGRASGGKTGGYEEKRDDTKVYGAYQIARGVWDGAIKSKYGWDFNDWFDPSGDSDKKALVKTRQDKIAKELLLPGYKAQVNALNLYDSPLGQHVPKGVLEIAAQLGGRNLQRFLSSGEDHTAFDKMKGGQILGYLKTAADTVGRPLGEGFYKALSSLGGVKTKYDKK